MLRTTALTRRSSSEAVPSQKGSFGPAAAEASIHGPTIGTSPIAPGFAKDCEEGYDRRDSSCLEKCVKEHYTADEKGGPAVVPSSTIPEK